MTVFSSLTAIASQPCSTAVAGCTPSGGHSPSRKLLAALLLGLAALAGCSQGQQASSRTTPPPVATAPASFAPATPQASTGSRIPTMPLQQLPAAAEHAQRAVTLQPDNILSWDVLAVAHWKQGQEQAASEAGSTALRLKDAANAALPAGWSLPAGTPAAMATQAGKQHVIAFSLWGHQPRYLLGMLHNAVLAPVLYPGWVLRCHVDDSVPADFLAALRALEVDVRRQPAGQSLRQKLCWRFLAANDPQVGYFLCRDADSVSGPREVQAVREWLESGRWFHTMRDWWSHTDLMLAGMWGGVAGVLPELQPRLLRYRSGAVETVNIDQWFLRDEVWRYVRTSCLIHDRCFRLHDSRPMPGLLPGQTDHVGIDASVALHQQQLRLLAPWIRELASLASLRPALQQLLQPSASPEPARP